MYKWKIELILKSGKELTVYHESKTAKNSRITAEEILDDICRYTGFNNEDNTKVVLVKLDEIAAVTISAV